MKSGHELLKAAQFHGARRLVVDKYGSYPPGFERPYLRKITWQLAAFYSLDVDYSTEELMRMEYVLRYNDLDVESTVMRLMTSCLLHVESVVMRQLAAFYSLGVDYSTEELMRMEYVLRYNELGVESTVMRLMTSLAFYSLGVDYSTEELMRMEYVLRYNDLDVESTGMKLMTSCEEMLVRCRWRNQMVNCSEIFHMQVTGDGICCIFNSKSLRHELDPLHATHIKPQVKWYTTLVGPAHGLTLLINQTQKHGSIDITYKWSNIRKS
ncbi:hypothetical protein JYU34_004970 [Plutella xylostella]|uniref:Uncharacterized protein n=1 Tax=Plutella xylostella TaxID=51655 RepID=A0ABQ7QVP5_PLUXY|nr:hypothetical protein JYU34_004970 [Plutella xylostella]